MNWNCKKIRIRGDENYIVIYIHVECKSDDSDVITANNIAVEKKNASRFIIIIVCAWDLAEIEKTCLKWAEMLPSQTN